MYSMRTILLVPFLLLRFASFHFAYSVWYSFEFKEMPNIFGSRTHFIWSMCAQHVVVYLWNKDIILIAECHYMCVMPLLLSSSVEAFLRTVLAIWLFVRLVRFLSEFYLRVHEPNLSIKSGGWVCEWVGVKNANKMTRFTPHLKHLNQTIGIKFIQHLCIRSEITDKRRFMSHRDHHFSIHGIRYRTTQCDICVSTTAKVQIMEHVPFNISLFHFFHISHLSSSRSGKFIAPVKSSKWKKRKQTVIIKEWLTQNACVIQKTMATIKRFSFHFKISISLEMLSKKRLER